jgi:flagellar hook-associated protein 2
MASSAIDGLVSGLDTTAIVTQLMSIERQPQSRLRTQRTDEQRRFDVHNTLNTRMRALADAARTLRFESGWNTRSAVSSDDSALVATAGAGSTPARLQLRVDRLAAAHSLLSSAGVASMADVVATGPLTIGSTTVSDIGDGSLASVIAAVNSSGAGVTASAVQVEPSVYRLQLSARSSGAAGVFTASGLGSSLGSLSILSQGQDAELTMGTTNPVTVRSASNTFTGLADGVTVTVKKQTSSAVSLDIGTDAGATATRVQKLVDAYNDVLSYVSANSGYDPATRRAGVLLGEQAASQVTSALRESLVVASSGDLTVFRVGMSTDRTGRLSFDRAAFLAAHDANPTGVKALFQGGTGGSGFAALVQAEVDDATAAGTGRLAGVIAGSQSRLRDLDSSIQSWDSRLASREKQIRSQFDALETALGRLRNQSSWLAGQIGKLQ